VVALECGERKDGGRLGAVESATVRGAVAVESGGDLRMGAIAATIREESERIFFYSEILWSNASDCANGITMLGCSGGVETDKHGRSDALPTTFPFF